MDSPLPIYEIKESLGEAIAKDSARIVIEAPTGSGKSTQVPQMLLDSAAVGSGEIVVLQPRRIAARLLATRVAQERRSRLGSEVGYQVRFENVSSGKTRIRFITEGILIRKQIEDPSLQGISAIVLDEFHERHFYGDISLARCLQAQREARPDLKILVMSATLEIEALLAYLGDGCSHLRSTGRSFPVAITYAPQRLRQKGQLWDHCCRAIGSFLQKQKLSGHILVFMPGKHEIRKTADAIRRASWSGSFEVHELYGELPPEKQDAAVDSRQSSGPRIIVSTNVAETSITIDGVELVVDAGLERRSDFDSRRGISTLRIEKISQASADQRAGRAGRTSAGSAIRLWSEQDHTQRPAATPAEIKRMDLCEVILILLASGVSDVERFPWFESPEDEALKLALLRLTRLGALEPDLPKLTRIGEQLSRLPVNPTYGRILIEAEKLGYLSFVAAVVAMAQSRPLFVSTSPKAVVLSFRDFVEKDDASDWFSYFRAWSQMKENGFPFDRCKRLGIHHSAARDIDRVSEQLCRILTRGSRKTANYDVPNQETFARILLTGFSEQIGKRNSSSTLACRLTGQRRGQLDKDSIAAKHDSLFIANEIIEIEGKDLQVKLSKCTCLDNQWVQDHFPTDFIETSAAVFNERNRRVEARYEVRFRDLVIESKAQGEPSPEQAAPILAAKILSGELLLKKWDQHIEDYINRISLVAKELPEYGIPDIDQDSRLLLLEQICMGGFSYKEIKDREVKPAVKQWLQPHQQSTLDALAPERIQLSNGKSTKVFYTDPDMPKISVLIQHLFGLQDSPAICDGRIPLAIEILAPNHRPIQLTTDLAGFWTGSYPAVRSQLRGRYPKHEWPEFD